MLLSTRPFGLLEFWSVSRTCSFFSGKILPTFELEGFDKSESSNLLPDFLLHCKFEDIFQWCKSLIISYGIPRLFKTLNIGDGTFPCDQQISASGRTSNALKKWNFARYFSNVHWLSEYFRSIALDLGRFRCRCLWSWWFTFNSSDSPSSSSNFCRSAKSSSIFASNGIPLIQLSETLDFIVLQFLR